MKADFGQPARTVSKLPAPFGFPAGMTRGFLLAAAIALAAAAAVPAAAFGEAGELDFSFGERGAVTIPTRFGTPWEDAEVQLAATPEGGSVLADDTEVFRFLADGQPDPSFGDDGRRAIELPEGAGFAIGDLAVDPEGRVVVIGTATRTNSNRTPPPRFATVLRYLPDGSLDGSFGAGDGHVISAYGLHYPSGPSSATGSFGAVDQAGEITLVVGTVQRESRCGGPARLRASDRLLVRLDSNGQPDRFFGERGTQTLAPLERVTGMAFSRGGEAMLAGSLPNCDGKARTGLVSFRPDGDRRLGFGVRGMRTLTGTAASLAVDSLGRTVVLFEQRQQRARDERDWKIARLLPGGDLDPSFAGGWTVYETEGPSYEWSSVVVDSHNRPLLVGTLVRELPPERFHRWLMVVPLRQSGKLRNRIGFRGWIAITRFNRQADATASEALLEGDGRLLIGGTVRWPPQVPDGGLLLSRLEV
jgi:uncharacterized delta-60 repeat protein